MATPSLRKTESSCVRLKVMFAGEPDWAWDAAANTAKQMVMTASGANWRSDMGSSSQRNGQSGSWIVTSQCSVPPLAAGDSEQMGSGVDCEDNLATWIRCCRNR